MEEHLSSLGEFGLIAQIRERFRTPDGVTGIGDDCAVLPQQFGRNTLVSTDMLIEGTHFLRRDITPYDLGWKSAAVNISDIDLWHNGCHAHQTIVCQRFFIRLCHFLFSV